MVLLTHQATSTIVYKCMKTYFYGRYIVLGEQAGVDNSDEFKSCCNTRNGVFRYDEDLHYCIIPSHNFQTYAENCLITTKHQCFLGWEL